MSASWIAFCIIMSYILLLCFIVYIGINLKTNKVMKELSNEDKAKRYDEAIERATKWYDANTNEGYRGIFEDIFPELKESKDEKIRKVIYGWIYTQPSQFFDSGFSKEEMLAWLEKQGEKYKFIEKELMCIKGYREKAIKRLEELEKQGEKLPFEMKTPEESLGIDSNTYNKIVDECIYGEQKPEGKTALEAAKEEKVDNANKIESKDYSSIDPHFFKTTDNVEPKFKVGDYIEPIDTCHGSPRTIYKICDGWYETNQGTLDFEFENNWRLIEQKPAWSEEDEVILSDIICSVNASDAFCGTILLSFEKHEKKISWLKSLKDRVGCEVNCTTIWKPSDEQMKQLGWIAKQNKDNMIGKELMSLYQDLKNKV